MSGRADVMKTYIPMYLRTSRVIASILNAEGKEIDTLTKSIEDNLSQFFVETAGEVGLVRWESFLKLSSPVGKTVEQRRERIISKIRGMGTVTVALMQNVAESFVYGHVAVTEHPEQYSFTVKFADPRGIPANLNDAEAAIEAIKPAHLAVIYEFTYTTYGELESLTYGQMKAQTYEELRLVDTI